MPRLAALIAILCAAAIASAADWPQWRGPLRNGVSAEQGLLASWPAGGPRLLWQIDNAGDGYGAPAVAGGRIYLLASSGRDSESVLALSPAGGKILWTTRIGSVGNPDQQPPYPMARSTPTVDGALLYALSSDGDLVCLESATGKLRWKKSLRADFAGRPGKWAYAESPLVDGRVLVITPGGAEATLAALDKTTGAVIWKSAVPGGEAAAYASAVVTEAAGLRQYVQFLDKGVVGVDARTGRYLWRYDKTASGPANIPTPVAHGGYVYSANARRFGAGLVQLHATAGGVSAEEVYFERDAPHTLGGQVLLDDGHIYGTNAKGLAAADFKTGKLRWQDETTGPGSVLFAAGRLYLHTEAGEMVLAAAAPDAYREHGRFKLPSPPPHRFGPREMAWAYPVVANGRLYVRDQGTLWCYDISAPPARVR